MAHKKVVTPATSKDKTATVKTPALPLFERDNYMWMIIGAVVVALGILLMAGGKSEDPSVFNYDEIYSTRRVTIAPLLIIIGLAIEIYAIFKKPKIQH